MHDRPGLFETIYTTRALRRFRPDPVPDEVLFQVLDAAIRAPSGQNAQDWRFVIIREPGAKARLAEWALDGWRRYQPVFAERPELLEAEPRHRRLPLKAVEHLVHHLGEVPVVVAACGMRGRHSTPGASLFPAVQNLLLAARGLGLGASIFNLPLAHRDELHALVGVPEEYEVACLVPLGYPLDRHGPVRRKPVARVAFSERWGEAWAFAQAQAEEGWSDRWIG